jgi:hypothetical protein
MNPTTGLCVLLCFCSHAAASSSASPPISPIKIMPARTHTHALDAQPAHIRTHVHARTLKPSVSGSATNLSKQSIKLVPLNGSPARTSLFVMPAHKMQMHSVHHTRTSNAHARRLPQARRRRLSDGLVRERARSRHDADLAGSVYVTGHDADLALAGFDDTYKHQHRARIASCSLAHTRTIRSN